MSPTRGSSGFWKKKKFPRWILDFVHSFLTARRTRITFMGYESDWIQVQARIPQGSPIFPILFLFFISELLETFQQANSRTLAFGFVDDTNILAWGDSA